MAYTTTVNVSSSAGSSYTWAGAGFAWQEPDGSKTWATAYPNVYTLSVGEGWSTAEAWNQRYTVSPYEGWRTGELWSQKFSYVINEAWRTTEVWTDIWQLMLRVFEAWATAEISAKSMLIPKTEIWATTEASSRAPQFNKLENWHITEAQLQQYQLTQQEGWNTAELPAKAVSRPLQEAWHTSDSQPVWSTVKKILEMWVNSESMNHAWQEFLVFVEGWVTAEGVAKAATKPLLEEWRTADSVAKASIKGILESWHTAEAPTTKAAFHRAFTEAWHMIDSLTKTQLLALLESLALDEAYLRNANAVISDLAFSSGDLTVDQFTSRVSSPVGYGPFTEFIPGELEYQKALIAIIIAGPLTAGRPQVTKWQLTVDVPNQTDSDTLSVSATNTFIPFKVRFFAPPEVIVQLRGGSTGTPDITGITDAGFYLQINDANGQPIAGDIVWSAMGY